MITSSRNLQGLVIKSKQIILFKAKVRIVLGFNPISPSETTSIAQSAIC